MTAAVRCNGGFDLSKQDHSRLALVTGGAGFIGSNLVQRLLKEPGTRVRVFDNFSRGGVARNAAWLRALPGADRLEIIEGDVRNSASVKRAVKGATEVFHLAAQVAVTTSVEDPASDFEVNAVGTFQVLEAARQSALRPFFLFTSTNKVYGSLEGVPVQVEGTRYRATDSGFRGVNEGALLDFHSPYGCSKGAADQYVRDYGRIYNLPTAVLRMSCIAGPRQFGNEDQGWVAHFLYSALAEQEITVYGDGHQVRDILHVYDLIDGMLAIRDHKPRLNGEVYNLGGGLSRAASVIEMLRAIERLTGKPLHLKYDAVRPGDQPLYVADTGKLERHTGWRATRSLEETLSSIHDFWKANTDAIEARFPSRTPELQVEEVA
jgi:CDP-paratose 2-epimerase